MVGDVTQGIAKDASLGGRPVAGKTGTSENYFDAWFLGYTPQLVTSTWMGYAEGGNTLEYVLDYARKLHGLPGGITPTMIWKTYTQQVLRGKPAEQFEGVSVFEQEDETTPAATGPVPRATNNVLGVRDRATADRRARGTVRRADRAAGGAPANAAPASASAPPARKERSRAARRGTVRAGNVPSSVAPSSASPSSVAPQ
jgi:penicillin-binding protein 1A